MKRCTKGSHANCVHPYGCEHCGKQCVGQFCSGDCYEAAREAFFEQLNETLYPNNRSYRA